MPFAVEEAACREELRCAGLLGQWAQARLLVLLREAPETHLGLSEVVRLAAAGGLIATPYWLARQLDGFADHGLLRRLPTTSAESEFDTITKAHAHLVYEDTGQTFDLHVSSETLLSLLRQALSETPNAIDILIRIRTGPDPLADAGGQDTAASDALAPTARTSRGAWRSA